jgi:hypothetical protein
MRTVLQEYRITIKNKTPKVCFEKAFMEAVDEGLSFIGESAKQSVYFHLKESFGIDKSDIPFKVEEFTIALKQIFGLGSKILLIEIMKRFHEKVRVKSSFS